MEIKIQYNSILGGWQPTEFFETENSGQVFNSLGIDPEMPKSDSLTRPSGLIRPTSMENFSGVTVTGVPLWLLTNPKNTNIYCYASNGKVHVINSDLVMGSDLSSPTNGDGQGAVYYNNYLYFATKTDISRYGPLSGSPSMANNFWTSTLSKTALNNKTYPQIQGVTIPNHPMYVHPWNNRIYFGDVDSNNVGIISMINTQKNSVEGDTDNATVPSSYKVLDTYFDWYPTCISSIGHELAIGLIEGTDTKIKQGNARIVFWSTIPSDTSYSRIAYLPDPLVTALININGYLYAFSGSSSGGMRVSVYLGGETFEEVMYLDDQLPPLQGAVESVINRLVWGNKTTLPALSASVFSLGSKAKSMGMGIHNILKTSSSKASPFVTAIKYVTQGSSKQPIVGWKDNDSKGLDKLSTTYGTNYLTFPIRRIGSKFQIKRVIIPLAQPISTNNSFEVRALIDGSSTDVLLVTVNSNNYEGKRLIEFEPISSYGYNDLCLQIKFTGSALTTIQLPVQVILELID